MAAEQDPRGSAATAAPAAAGLLAAALERVAAAHEQAESARAALLAAAIAQAARDTAAARAAAARALERSVARLLLSAEQLQRRRPRAQGSQPRADAPAPPPSPPQQPPPPRFVGVPNVAPSGRGRAAGDGSCSLGAVTALLACHPLVLAAATAAPEPAATDDGLADLDARTAAVHAASQTERAATRAYSDARAAAGHPVLPLSPPHEGGAATPRMRATWGALQAAIAARRAATGGLEAARRELLVPLVLALVKSQTLPLARISNETRRQWLVAAVRAVAGHHADADAASLLQYLLEALADAHQPPVPLRHWYRFRLPCPLMQAGGGGGGGGGGGCAGWASACPSCCLYYRPQPGGTGAAECWGHTTLTAHVDVRRPAAEPPAATSRPVSTAVGMAVELLRVGESVCAPAAPGAAPLAAACACGAAYPGAFEAQLIRLPAAQRALHPPPDESGDAPAALVVAAYAQLGQAAGLAVHACEELLIGTGQRGTAQCFRYDLVGVMCKVPGHFYTFARMSSDASGGLQWGAPDAAAPEYSGWLRVSDSLVTRAAFSEVAAAAAVPGRLVAAVYVLDPRVPGCHIAA